MQRESYLNRDFTPFELYIKFLIEYFGSSVEFDPSSVTDFPEGFLRLSYQIDAVNQGFELLWRHGGFFLADVVGLGKTIIAALIAKKFFYFNDFPAHISTTLIIVPPALKDAWETTLRKFELKNFKIVTNGSVHKIEHPDEFDLVIVDEAHKFRNDESGAYDALQRLCKTPTKRRLPGGSFAKKCVILVSATPLNNRPEDIRNLTLIFQDGKDSTVEGTANLQNFFATSIKAFDLARRDPNRNSTRRASDAERAGGPRPRREARGRRRDGGGAGSRHRHPRFPPLRPHLRGNRPHPSPHAMKFELTKHAARALAEREIRVEWLERTLAAPELRLPDPDDAAVERFYRRIPEFGGRVLRVAVNQTG